MELRINRAGALVGTAVFIVLLGVSPSGCASDMHVGFHDDAGVIGPGFSSPESASVDAGGVSTELGLCPSNKCPPGRLTCDTSAYLCDVDPLLDNQNCGGCGQACAGFVPSLKGAFVCVNGACELICGYSNDGTPFMDCDGIRENGCETRLGSSENCTSCNHKCTSPERCLAAYVGCGECQAPFVPTECGCKDLISDDKNCGACGVVCDESPAGFDPAPPNSYYGCRGGACNRLKCDNRRDGVKWSDCNGDLEAVPTSSSDGCEIDLAKPAPDNCGACGVTCAPGETCATRAEDPDPTLQCLCKSGEANCGEFDGSMLCADLNNDPFNCGACGRVCPLPGWLGHATTVCHLGSCGITCDDGWADCNDFAGDGCETNVQQDPANCGACGRVCDGGPSQACVGGRCVVEDCEEGTPR